MRYERVEEPRRRGVIERRKRVYHTNYEPDADRWEEIEETQTGWSIMYHSRVQDEITDRRWVVPYCLSFPKGADLNEELNDHGLTRAAELIRLAGDGVGMCLRLYAKETGSYISTR